MVSRAFAFLFLATPAAIASHPAGAQQRFYTVRDLGSLGGRSYGNGINPLGHTVGYSYVSANAYHPFLNSGLGPIDLGTLGGATGWALALNSAGQVVGDTANGSGLRRAFFYSGGSMIDITPAGGSQSSAEDINASGIAVGWYNEVGKTTGFIYDNGNTTILPSVGGNTTRANAINSAGYVTGRSLRADNFGRAFIYRDGNMIELPPYPGGNDSWGADINEQGDVVGWGITSDGHARALLYTGGQMIALPDFGGRSSHANAINNLGEIVGYSDQPAGGRSAIVYVGGTTFNLNAQIAQGTGWDLEEANDINDLGEIVGIGTLNGQDRAFLLQPIPTVVVSPDTARPGDTLTVNWTAPNFRSSTDWIGLYRTSGLDIEFLWWRYTNGATSGSETLRITEPGEYEIRYFNNNSYERAATSNRIVIQSDQVNASLTVSSTSVVVKAPLSVSWTVNAGRPATDWIGLFKAGDPNQAYGWWRHTVDAASGTFDLTAPEEPGQYEFRYLLENGYTHAAVSPAVSVSRPGSYTLTVSPTTVPPSGTVTIAWESPIGSSPRDWIALYPAGEPDNRKYLWPHWFYTGGAASGSRQITMPSPPGRYVFRYLLDNGYTHTAESAVTEVR